MKRGLCCALALALIFCLAACGSGSVSKNADKSIYKPGTYSATANGIGTVTVKVTVDAKSITAVDLDLSDETESVGQAAGDTLKQQILHSQGDGIDGVSGATVTSAAVKTALADCLTQAKG